MGNLIEKAKAGLQKKMQSKKFRKNLRHDLEIAAVIAVFLIYRGASGKPLLPSDKGDDSSFVSGIWDSSGIADIVPETGTEGVQDTESTGGDTSPSDDTTAVTQDKTMSPDDDEWLSQYGPFGACDWSAEQEYLYAKEEYERDPHRPLIASEVPEYTGSAYVEINDNTPNFDYASASPKINPFAYFSQPDAFGRPQSCYGCFNLEMLPQENTPDHDNAEDTFPLISRILYGSDIMGCNAVAGSDVLRDTLRQFELQIASYIRETENKVYYRVTPVFDGKATDCMGIQLECYSIEDKGEGLMFNVFVYNKQCMSLAVGGQCT